MFFFWRINKQIDELATTLADELYSQVTPEMLTTANKKADKKISKLWDKQVDDIVFSINQYKLTHSLGIYRKARLHQSFMKRLEVHGFSKTLIKELNEHLLLKTP